MTESSCYNFTPALTKKCGTHRNIAPGSPTEQTEGPEADFFILRQHMTIFVVGKSREYNVKHSWHIGDTYVTSTNDGQISSTQTFYPERNCNYNKVLLLLLLLLLLDLLVSLWY